MMRLAILTSVLLLPVLAGCGGDKPANAAGSGNAGSNSGTKDPLQPPAGLASAKLLVPNDNPLTAAKAALGKKLFFDPRLSASGEMGCVNCHYPDQAFTDGEKVSKKDNGGMNSRNSPTMYNVGYYPHLYWDGRKVGLESNVLAAWTGQLGGKPEEVAAKLNAIDAYKAEFEAAFNEGASEKTIVHALSSFLRTLRSGNSPYDKFMAGDESAMTDEQKAGHMLFTGKAGCAVCHTPVLFTDAHSALYHNTGIGMDAESPDLGRAKATEKEADNGKFKTPTLREIANTAPYFHDGSVASLEEAVRIMASGGIANPNKDTLLMDKDLTDEEIGQIVAFLGALSGTVPFEELTLPE